MQKIMRSFLVLSMLLTGLIVISGNVLAETEFKMITLQHRFASDLLPTILPMVGLDGTATGINNELILRASPERMREIEALVEKLDTARVNRRISVQNSAQIQSQRDSAQATGAVTIGDVTITNDRRSSPNSARVDIERSTSNSRQNVNQFINVLDGERAFISNGQIVPFTQEWISISRRYVQIDRFTDWREVTTGFAVRPRTIGNQVELEITPRIARVNNQGFIDFEQLKTIIRIGLGEWVDIGGTMKNKDEVSRKILRLQSSANTQNSSLSIKVD